MTRRKHILLDPELYEELRQRARALGLYIPEYLKLLLSDSEKLLLVRGKKKFFVIKYSEFLRILKENSELKREINELREKIPLISAHVSRRLKTEIASLLSEKRKLVSEMRQLRKEIEKLEEEKRNLEQRFLKISSEKDAIIRELTRMWLAGALIKALKAHGLLAEAKKWLRGEKSKVDLYFRGDDIYYAVLECRDYILAADERGEAKKKRPIYWVL